MRINSLHTTRGVTGNVSAGRGAGKRFCSKYRYVQSWCPSYLHLSNAAASLAAAQQI